MSKNVQNTNLMGSLKRGVNYEVLRGIPRDLLFIIKPYNYTLQEYRRPYLQKPQKVLFFGHFSYEHLISLMRF